MNTYCELVCKNISWSWSEAWNSTVPDLPECFQITAFPFILSLYFIIVVLAHIMKIKNDKTSSRPVTKLFFAKVILVSLFCLSFVAELIGYLILQSFSLFFIAPPVYFFLGGMMILILFLEKRCNGINSGQYFLFWFIIFIFSIIRVRSVALQVVEELENKEIVFRCAINAVQLLLILSCLVTACISDRITLDVSEEEKEKECPETNASFLSRILFWWLNKIIILGYKKPLTKDHLWHLNRHDRCNFLVPIFIKIMNRYLSPHPAAKAKPKSETNGNESLNVTFNANHSGNEGAASKPLLGADKEEGAANVPDVTIVDGKTKEDKKAESKKAKEKEPKEPFDGSLLKSLVVAYGPQLGASAVLKLFNDVLQFCSPLLLKLLIGFIGDTTQPVWRGYLYAVLLFVVAAIQTLFVQQYFHIVFCLGMRVKSTLISAVYRKAFLLNNAAKRDSTTGEIVNLMSVDAQKFLDLLTYLNIIWSGPLQIILAISFLWNILGPSVLAGVAILLLLLPLNAFIGNITRRLQARQMKHKDSRIKLMNEILNGIKVLKLYAWEKSFINQILQIRSEELSVLRKSCYLNAVSSFSFICAPFFVSLTTFGVYVLSSPDNVLDAEKAFVSLSLFNILRFPLMMFPMVFANIIQTSVSLKRLTKFLRQPEIDPDAVQHADTPGMAIEISQGTFAWDVNDEPILKDIDFKSKDGELVAVVGPVGAGKSSLVSAILGNVEKIEGSVNVKGSISYVAQQAWIRNATIKDNILFNKELDENRYQTVLDACELRQDLTMFADGDQTEIGEKGINLSGGQKQRISLARACYANTDIYLLDDPLSAVDSHVAKKLMDNVIGRCGLLAGSTRVLVTHNVGVVPQCDTVVVMDGGRISESGSYAKLLEHAGPFATFMAIHLMGDTATNDAGNVEEMDKEEREKLLKKLEEAYAKENKSDECPVDAFRDRLRTNSLHNPESEPLLDENNSAVLEEVGEETKKPTKKLIEDETSKVGNVKLSVFLVYLRAMGIVYFLLVLLLNICSQAAALGSNIWLADWSSDSKRNADRLAAENNSTFLSNTSTASPGQPDWMIAQRDRRLGIYGLLGFLQALIHFTCAILFVQAQSRGSFRLHNHMLDSILRCPTRFFDTVPLGRILNRFTNDMTVVDMILPMAINTTMGTMLMTLTTLVAMVIPNQWIILPLLVVIALYLFIQRFYVASSRQLKRLESTFKSPIYSHFSETLQGSSSIRAYGMMNTFIDISDSKVDMSNTAYYPVIVSNRWLAVRLETIGNLIVLMAAIFAVASRSSGLVTAGLAGLSVTYAMGVTQTLNWMVRMTSELEANIVAVERIKEYSTQESEAPWEIENTKPDPDWPRGEIRFTDYSTRYRPGLDLVLDGVNCSIAAKEKVGIVGRTGSGKSSLVLALFRMIEPAGGTIYVDDKDITTLGLHDIRGRITIIPQDPVLFAGNLRVNLDPFEDHPDSDLWNVLDLANLKSYVQETSPVDGLRMKIAEGGENMSVGQRQLVCLARALLRRSRVLVLDEATAAVDLDTDALIQSTIRKEFKDSTVITIAHRLNTVLDYDKILVLDSGKIKEFDSPKTLIQDTQSMFYAMAKDANLVKTK